MYKSPDMLYNVDEGGRGGGGAGGRGGGRYKMVGVYWCIEFPLTEEAQTGNEGSPNMNIQQSWSDY